MKRHPQIELDAGEQIVVPARKAVHTDRGRKAGGRLLVTDRRVIFNANFLDSWFFASVALEFSEISNVDVASRSYNAYDGGLARRLDVHLHDGGEHLFVLASGRRRRQVRRPRQHAHQPVCRRPSGALRVQHGDRRAQGLNRRQCDRERRASSGVEAIARRPNLVVVIQHCLWQRPTRLVLLGVDDDAIGHGNEYGVPSVGGPV